MTPLARAAARATTMPAALPASLELTLPESLLAHEPPEARGLARDEVRLLVSDATSAPPTHATVRDLPHYVRAGDILVVNASATINAALDAWRPGHAGLPDELITLHLSSPVPYGDETMDWVIELRRLTRSGTTPLLDARPGEWIRLRGGGSAVLVAPFPAALAPRPSAAVRLWTARLELPGGVLAYAAEHGAPIRYAYVTQRWPLAYYQTIFATEPGSAEMPSAGRPFTSTLVARLEAMGVTVAPIVLHTGVGSLEAGEAPYPERYRVPDATADAVNNARGRGGRVIAVGTTVVRALETVATSEATVRAGAGWTDVVITPERGVRVVDSLLTGFHEPRASHLAMLEAIAGPDQLARAYESALRAGYLWHEFGDVHLAKASR